MRIHCSQLGKIMTNPRSKNDLGLSATAKAHVEEQILRREFGIVKEFWSRYTDKGIRVEEQSIKLCEKVLDFGLLWKNDEVFQNDYIIGVPDVITDKVLLDVKSAWDGTTFPWFLKELKNKDYYFQMQGYMWLTGKTESYLCYCLIDTPEDILQDEIRRQHWELKQIENADEIEDFVRKKHSFNHIPNDMKVKTFKVDFDEEVVEKMITRINKCNDYYKIRFKELKEEQLIL